MPPRFILPLIFVTFLISACNPDTAEKPKGAQVNQDSLKIQFIRANKQLVQKESDEMDYYASAHQMPFTKTSSGIRYYVYQPSVKGDSITDTSTVTLSYKVSLLDGTPVYSSETEGKKTFMVGHENIESGVHKALLYLKRGDKALILIPSHLAHGLLGDFKKVPPQMPIIYDIEVR